MTLVFPEYAIAAGAAGIVEIPVEAEPDDRAESKTRTAERRSAFLLVCRSYARVRSPSLIQPIFRKNRPKAR